MKDSNFIIFLSICTGLISSGISTVKYFTDDLQRHNIHLKLVLGFSTGHVGTTSLSDKNSYERINMDGQGIVFVFERAFVNRTKYSASWTTVDEIDHVQRTYGPYVLFRAGQAWTKLFPSTFSDVNFSKNITIVDLSHSCLYFYRGIIAIAELYPDNISLQFVRIRRDRIETVVSMTGDVNFFTRELAVFEPFVNVHDVILKIINVDEWDRFDLTQKILWVIDETESRWRRLLREHVSLKYIEILWGNRWENSINSSMNEISYLLRTKRTNTSHAPAFKPHAGADRRTIHFVELSLKIAQMDREYQLIMNYTYVPG